VLATRIREQILSGVFAQGQPLPNERDLAIQTGLGRGTIREALRVLENQGLIETRPGRNGGSVVCRPGRRPLVDTIETFIRGHQLRMEALLEARAGVEPAAARYAAIHHEARDLEKLRDAQQRLAHAIERRDLPGYLRANADWHLAVVHASHNELLIAFMTAIAGAVHAATAEDNFNSDEVQQDTLRAHARILDAILARDADAAERRMRRHVDAYVTLVDESRPRPSRQIRRKARRS
jgi:DNA-binding FadR family transcriptional regulator